LGSHGVEIGFDVAEDDDAVIALDGAVDRFVVLLVGFAVIKNRGVEFVCAFHKNKLLPFFI
jgi:hypothetical protein